MVWGFGEDVPLERRYGSRSPNVGPFRWAGGVRSLRPEPSPRRRGEGVAMQIALCCPERRREKDLVCKRRRRGARKWVAGTHLYWRRGSVVRRPFPKEEDAGRRRGKPVKKENAR